jgi:protein required for attachment to host cells
MDTVWIVVADAARARIICTQGRPGRTLEDIEAFSHSQSRQHNQDLVTDRPGRNQASGRGDGRHAMGAPTDPAAHERELFARQLAERLQRAHLQGSFQHLVLVAEPGFLGELRAALDDGVANAVSHAVGKNIVKVEDHATLRSHLPDFLY